MKKNRNEERRARIAALRASAGLSTVPLAQPCLFVVGTAAVLDGAVNAPLSLKKREAMPFGVALIDPATGEPCAYFEMRDHTRGDAAPSKAIWFISPRRDAFRILVIDSSSVVVTAPPPPRGPTPREAFEDAVCAYWERLRDVAILRRLGYAHWADGRNALRAKWTAAGVVDADYVAKFIAVAAAASAGAWWCDAEAEMTRIMADPTSLSSVEVPLALYLGAVADTMPTGEHARWLSLGSGIVAAQPAAGLVSITREAVAHCWLPRQRRVECARLLERANAMPDGQRDAIRGIAPWLFDIVASAAFGPLPTGTPLRALAAVEEGEYDGWVPRDALAYDDRTMAEVAPISLGSTTVEIEDLPPCLAAVARRGRLEGKLKYMDRLQAAAQMRALEIRDPAAIYGLFVGRAPPKHTKGDDTWNCFVSIATAAESKYAFGCGRIVDRGKFPADTTLACCAGGRSACRAQSGLPPVYEMPAAYVALKINQRIGSAVILDNDDNGADTIR